MHVPEPKKTSSGWRIQLRIGGQSIPVTADTPKECKRQAALIKAEAQAAAKPVKKCSLTLSQAIDAYIASLPPDISPATLRSYRSIQKNRFPSLMQKQISSISTDDLQQALNDALATQARKTVKNSFGLVKSVLSVNGMTIPRNLPIDRRDRKKAAPVWLEPDEIKRFVAAAKDDPLCVPMLLALMSMRISEIDALFWENIPPHPEFIRTSGVRIMDEKHQWTTRSEQKTTESDRSVPLLIPELRAAIDRDRKPSGKLLEVHQMTLRRAVERTCDRAGVKRVTVHQLRYSFASLSAHLRIPAEISMEIGGWSNDKIMKEIYTHIARSDIERYKNEMWIFYNTRSANQP